MIHDLETLVRADLHRAADPLTYEPDLVAIMRGGRAASNGRRWRLSLLAVAAAAAVAVTGLQFVNRTVPAQPPAPLGQPSDTNPPLKASTRTHLTSRTLTAGVDVVMTQDGGSVVFTSGSSRVTVPVPEPQRAVWNHDFAPFGAMVINGPATTLRYREGLGGLNDDNWTLAALPGTTLTVAIMGLSEPAVFDIGGLVWGDASGGFHSFTGQTDSVVRFTFKATWPSTKQPMTWVFVEDPVSGVISWTEGNSTGGLVDDLGSAGAMDRVKFQYFPTVGPGGVWDPKANPNGILVAHALLPSGAGQVLMTGPTGFAAQDQVTTKSFSSGLQVMMGTWTGPIPYPAIKAPGLGVTYTTVDGRQVVLPPRK